MKFIKSEKFNEIDHSPLHLIPLNSLYQLTHRLV